MDELVAFLNARLSEEHFFAYKFVHTDGGEWTSEELARLWWYSDPPKSRSANDPIIQHAAYYNPARALREVEAKRAIVAACAETLQGEDSHDYLTEGGTGEEYELARFVLRQLAAAWSNHADYRPD